MIYIIGVGGVGSMLAPVMMKVAQEVITVIDGDVIEKKNLDRQMFGETEIGKYKARVMADRLQCNGVAHWFTDTLMPLDRSDILFCCADNHPCRRMVLRACDLSGCKCIIAANETTSSEAYYYQPDWKGTPSDPREYYPEIGTSEAGDPRRAAMGCTGEAQAANPQLASANFMAAALAMHLHLIWFVKGPKLKADTRMSLPYRLYANLSLLGGVTIKDGI